MILVIDGEPVDGIESFVDLVSSLKPKVRITVLALDHKNGRTGEIQVTVR